MSSFGLMFFAVLALGGLQLQVTAAVPDHMQFTFANSGVIQMKHKRKLRLNVKGGALQHGDPIVLWTAQEVSHAQFGVEGGSIQLLSNPSMCLNIEGGLATGHNLVTWPCQGKRSGPNEEFKFGRGEMAGRIHPKSDSNLCLNVKGGDFEEGAEIVLWQCEGSGHNHEVFKLVGNRITVLSHPELHFNVVGGDMTTPGVKVVLYKHHPSPNELFEISEGRIHLKQHPELCLNAEGGLSAGHRMVVWPCSPEPADNELFYFDKNTGAIHSSKVPDLAFNAAGGSMTPGDEIVLWSTKEEL